MCSVRVLGLESSVDDEISKAIAPINPIPVPYLQSHHPYVQDQPHRHTFLRLGK